MGRGPFSVAGATSPRSSSLSLASLENCLSLLKTSILCASCGALLGLPCLGCSGKDEPSDSSDEEAGSTGADATFGTDELLGDGGSGGTGASAGLGRGSGASGGFTGSSGSGASSSSAANLEPFSFFVTSLQAMQELSGTEDGFGGDLRFGKLDGLAGADAICTEIAERSLPGSGAKGWRAFLSVTAGPDGTPVHARDRIGQGPWYDRTGRLVAQNLTDLVNTRPVGAHEDIINDLPNEYGTPNHDADGDGSDEDNHDTLTGTNDRGELFSDDPAYTCQDWTSSVGSAGTPRVGHTWPTGGASSSGPGGGRRPGGGGDMSNWMSALTEAGCAAGVNLVEMGGPIASVATVGSGGGYGGIYCFALTP